MHFSNIIRNLWSNQIWRYFWFLHWSEVKLQPLATALFFFLLVSKVMQIWSINYALHLGSFKKYVRRAAGRGSLKSELKRTGKPVCTFPLWKKLSDFQTAGRVLSDKLLNVFRFEPSPAYNGVFLLKRRRYIYFFHLTFFCEHVNICIVIVCITV